MELAISQYIFNLVEHSWHTNFLIIATKQALKQNKKENRNDEVSNLAQVSLEYDISSVR